MVHEPAIGSDNEAQKAKRKAPMAVDTELSATDHIVDQDIELIVQWTKDLFSSDQIIKAKEDFYWKSGKVFSHEEWFHRRMSYFIDQFVFSRVLEIKDDKFKSQTPYEAYKKDPNLPTLSLKSFRHSFFKVTKIGLKTMNLKDLLQKKKHVITSRPNETFQGVEKGHIFQGFFYDLGYVKFLSRGLVFHPKKSHGFLEKCIKKHLKSETKDEAKFLSLAAKAQLKTLRHPHVAGLTIYKEHPLLDH